MLIGLAATVTGSPSIAQVGGAVTIDSDYRFRARSLSNGRPVATLALSYDDRSGTYAGVAATAILSGSKAGGLVSQQIYLGYARRTASSVNIDVGATAYRYTSLYSARRRELFGEFYVGASAADISAYVRFSPDYYGQGGPVVYLDIATNKEIAQDIGLFARVGFLQRLSRRPTLGRRPSRQDVEAGIAREFGRLTVKARLVVGGPDDAYFKGVWRGRSSLSLTLQRRF